MNGPELKERIKDLHLTSRQVAAEMGVAEQSMTSFYKSTDIRKSTLTRIDDAIKKLTNGTQSIFAVERKETTELTPVNEPDSAKDELIAELRKQIASLQEQLNTKDEQIKALTDIMRSITRTYQTTIDFAAEPPTK